MGISETGYNEIIKDLSGSVTQNRFKYQRFWAIKKMYELYEKGDEFIVIFDFASDIDVSINNDLHFYQVKTNKNKNFTINRIIKTKKESKYKTEHSILSKLGTLENCKGAKSLNVVSNNYLSEKDKNDKELEVICFHELKKEIQNQITSHIKEKVKIVPDL